MALWLDPNPRPQSAADFGGADLSSPLQDAAGTQGEGRRFPLPQVVPVLALASLFQHGVMIVLSPILRVVVMVEIMRCDTGSGCVGVCTHSLTHGKCTE